MVHQRWDVPTWYDGSWGCGPTSAIMAISYWGRLAKKPIHCAKPAPHTNDYGFYLPNNYTYGNHVFNKMDRDAARKPAWGAYGSCNVNGAGYKNLINQFVRNHGLQTTYHDSGSTYKKVKDALDRKNPVILDTKITKSGHIVVVRGYDSDGKLIINDPYGDAMKSGYGQHTNGEGVRYTFDFTKAAGFWMIEVHKP